VLGHFGNQFHRDPGHRLDQFLVERTDRLTNQDLPFPHECNLAVRPEQLAIKFVGSQNFRFLHFQTSVIQCGSGNASEMTDSALYAAEYNNRQRQTMRKLQGPSAKTKNSAAPLSLSCCNVLSFR
jgi:hypothetical protein